VAGRSVLVIPKVKAPGLDEAFLTPAAWHAVPAVRLVRSEDGDLAALATEVRVAWSVRGLHCCYYCTDPDPLSYDFARDAAIDEAEVVGVFLDPRGDRSQYVAILASPHGRVADSRIENPLHHGLLFETDATWDCAGVRVRSWSHTGLWTVEMLIPFDGLTPAIDPPAPGDRWTGNFYRIERQPFAEITAWQPCHCQPVDLHDTEHFGIIEFGIPPLKGEGST